MSYEKPDTSLKPVLDNKKGFFQNMLIHDYEKDFEHLTRSIANDSLNWYLEDSWTKLDYDKNGKLNFYVVSEHGSKIFKANIDDEWISETCEYLLDWNDLKKLADKLQSWADFVRAEANRYDEEEHG
jgi:hypothetical protein